jgi:WD40-like Beta Propeller Repeat
MRCIFISCFFIPAFIHAQINNAYFNQTLPGNKLTMFAPNIISDEFGNRDMAVSPKGDEIFYILQYNYGMLSTILYSKKINGKWSSPEVANFCGKYKDLEPAFSYDGAKLYFSSDRPLVDTGHEKDYDVWYVTKMNGKWMNPVNIKSPVNRGKDEYYASVAKNNNIYFTRAVEGLEEDIMVCKFVDGKYSEAESLPDSINSTGDEFNAFVDPDETYIIFSGYKRKDGYGSGDLYISKKNEKGEWQQTKKFRPAHQFNKP